MATRKPAAKKAAAPAKRVYRRKAVVADFTPEPQEEVSQELGAMTEGPAKLNLLDVNALDLCQMELPFRAMTLGWLSDLGYLWSHSLKKPMSSVGDLHYTQLHFNHANKLITVTDTLPEDVEPHNMHIDAKVDFNFSALEVQGPATIVLGGVVYNRA